ncbi:MAG: tRNA (adenosine(37)-N6)-threonylcarbamoyltransferase complex ATPase subunit type 1 TsaE [Clostridiales bacterium]|nr:tRNA (adenosine(37)-N6)-threonylcarbamoyltransferase complex ATPase subunit type 1 TsaE [Clostridiales bacterium]
MTRQLGFRLAQQLLPGDVLILRGDMGAGKSEFTRGIARGLGIEGYLPSPSFTIMQMYETGRLPLYHFDWYRLESEEELYELSMEEYLYGSGVAVVEWPSMAEEAVPQTHLEITLSPAGEDQREITLRPVGNFHSLDLNLLLEDAQ